MAGTYPDPPGLRMPYDRDGTVGITTVGGVPTTITAGNLIELNNEDLATFTIAGKDTLVLLFPELRDIVGYNLHVTSNGGGWATLPMLTSVDTTNGVDGAWVTRVASSTYVTSGTVPIYRTGIVSVSWTGAKAIRIPRTGGGQIIWWHLYGGPAAGQNPNRLRLWHPTIDMEVSAAYFDWADFPRSTSADRTFRLKNNSASLTANTITVSTNTLTDATPSVPGQHLLQKASVPGTFAATVALTSLAPGAISEVLTLRRVTPVNAGMGLWDARVLASAASWV